MVIKFSILYLDDSIVDHIVNIVTAVVMVLGGDLIVEIEPLEIPDEVSHANEPAIATDD